MQTENGTLMPEYLPPKMKALSAFNKAIRTVTEYYRSVPDDTDKNYTIETLADAIGINERTLQKWESEDVIPNPSSIDLLYSFLKDHGGNDFVVRLKQVLGARYVESPHVDRGVFPKELDKNDIEIIRANFPCYDELLFLGSMINNENRACAANEVMPNGTIMQKAALISRWEASMRRSRDVFGFEDITDWKFKVIMFIDDIPKIDGDVEALGQRALDNIVFGYLERKRERNER